MRIHLQTPAICLACLTLQTSLGAEGSDSERYDVFWESPSQDAGGSMPLGNGDIGLNAWMEPDGSLNFYISKSDSWSENGRLLKVGRVRVTTDPPLTCGLGFEQRLNLEQGCLEIHTGEGIDATTTRLWVDANHPVITVTLEGQKERTALAQIELWRTERTAYPSAEVSDLLEDRSKPEHLHGPVFVEPDTIIEELEHRIGWFHCNEVSRGPSRIAELQGLSPYFEDKPDPLLGRIFGAIIAAPGGVRIDSTRLQSPPSDGLNPGPKNGTKNGTKNGPKDRHRFDIFVTTEHPSSPSQWRKNLDAIANAIQKIPFEQRRKEHEAWWRKFWQRSWIHVTQSAANESHQAVQGPVDSMLSDATLVSRAYALQRWINACAGRGRFPIKFNGSIFTVPHRAKFGDADYRRWGPGYWWQNTRLPYLNMCASGDTDLMLPLFRMYAQELLPLHEFRTRLYTGSKGAFIPECIYFWGPTFTATYGWTPFKDRGEDKLQESPWHKWEWVSGLELVWMMLDYAEHTQDQRFESELLLPTAEAILTFFDEHYDLDEQGKLIMAPAQALETWWDCTNPMPEVAGLLAVTSRLLAFVDDRASEEERALWLRLQGKTPELPTWEKDGVTLLAPAARFENKQNVENPELYAVFPFRLVAFEKDNRELGIATLENRWDRGAFGWRQDDLFMTHLGLGERARVNLVTRAKNHDAGSRFPAFWGPNYDWVPDQDHGGILMRTLQTMLMQTDGRKIHLLPAWPEGWDAEFRLHAPYQTTLTGKVVKGRIIDLVVTPKSRRGDVQW